MQSLIFQTGNINPLLEPASTNHQTHSFAAIFPPVIITPVLSQLAIIHFKMFFEQEKKDVINSTTQLQGWMELFYFNPLVTITYYKGFSAPEKDILVFTQKKYMSKT